MSKILIQADYSKAETWVVASLADDAAMLNDLKNGDFHSDNASNILGKKVDKSMYSDYQLGKRVGHGANYNMTAFLLQSVLAKDGYTYDKAGSAFLMEKYHTAYPGIRGCYHNGIKEDLSRDMTLTNPFGRKITFWDFWGNSLFNKAYAWIPQSTIGDMTNTALCNVYENMADYVDMRLQCHDSLVMQVDHKNLTPMFIDDLKGNMSFPLTVKNTTFTVPIDVEAGLNWYHMDELYVKDDEVWAECKPEHLHINDWLQSKGI